MSTLDRWSGIDGRKTRKLNPTLARANNFLSAVEWLGRARFYSGIVFIGAFASRPETFFLFGIRFRFSANNDDESKGPVSHVGVIIDSTRFSIKRYRRWCRYRRGRPNPTPERYGVIFVEFFPFEINRTAVRTSNACRATQKPTRETRVSFYNYANDHVLFRYVFLPPGNFSRTRFRDSQRKRVNEKGWGRRTSLMRFCARARAQDRPSDCRATGAKCYIYKKKKFYSPSPAAGTACRAFSSWPSPAHDLFSRANCTSSPPPSPPPPSLPVTRYPFGVVPRTGSTVPPAKTRYRPARTPPQSSGDRQVSVIHSPVHATAHGQGRIGKTCLAPPPPEDAGSRTLVAVT